MGCGTVKQATPAKPQPGEATPDGGHVSPNGFEIPPPRPEITVIAKADADKLTFFDEKFVVPDGKPCILHFKRKFLDPNGDDDDRRIEDLNGSGLSFQVSEIDNENAPKKVSDSAGRPVFNVITLGPFAMMQDYDANGKPVVARARFRVTAAARQDGKAVNDILTENHASTDAVNKRGEAIELFSNFKCTGEACVTLDGGLWSGKADPSQPAIAKVDGPNHNAKWPLYEQFPDAGLMNTSHVLEIPPGADAALMVAFFIASFEVHRSFSKCRGAAVPSDTMGLTTK